MSAAPSSLLILGGARSGKSRHALEQARSLGEPTAFVATAQALDGEMALRIQRHKAERPTGWLTVEEPLELVGALRRLVGQVQVVVVDCLTLWVANRLQREAADEPVLAEANDLAKLLEEHPYHAILVSNEVGLGVHPPTAVGLRFQNLLGSVNQRVAAASDRVVWMTAGLPITLKDECFRERAAEAP
ncbi:MAG: bifunctional adenosylcobinamide kinase/adenosylcobinamide-phosphate guanylyltransferase [Candidatus Rokubacteria bacterium]|nr:bifunctional adenosylcobinamide kinase/adenosylcobinamide-phosphate guanylyltransferase [Candidatus Rokubacteria bacterium]